MSVTQALQKIRQGLRHSRITRRKRRKLQAPATRRPVVPGVRGRGPEHPCACRNSAASAWAVARGVFFYRALPRAGFRPHEHFADASCRVTALAFIDDPKSEQQSVHS